MTLLLLLQFQCHWQNRKCDWQKTFTWRHAVCCRKWRNLNLNVNCAKWNFLLFFGLEFSCVPVPTVSPCLLCHCAYCHPANLSPCIVCHCAYCHPANLSPCLVSLCLLCHRAWCVTLHSVSLCPALRIALLEFGPGTVTSGVVLWCLDAKNNIEL